MLLLVLLLPFPLVRFAQSIDVAFTAVELCAEESGDELARERRTHDLRSEAEHVHVVVLDTLVGGVGVVADRGADAGDLARRDRGADAGAADEHGSLRIARRHGLADLARLVRVVDADRVRVGAEVDDLVVGERLEHGGAQLDAAMVESHGHSHETRSSSAVARATTLSTLKPSFSSTVVPG